MKEHYDPEDLEQLMRERHFSELLEEEQAYVLRHMRNEEEYEEVRRTLLAVAHHMDQEPELQPDPSIKQALLQEMAHSGAAKEERGDFTIWLNSLGAFFFPPGRSFYAQPGLQLAFTLVLVVGLFLLFRPNPNDLVAVNEELPVPLKKQEEEQPSVKEQEQEADLQMGLADSISTTLAESRQDNDLPALGADQLVEERMVLADAETEGINEVDEATISLERRNQSGMMELAEDEEAEPIFADVRTIDATEESKELQLAGYTDSLPVRMGNMAVPNVAESLDRKAEDHEQLAARSRSSKKDKAQPALSSVSLRQYSDLIGLLHTAQ